MASAEPLAEVWRNDVLESVHMGHAVVVDETGQVVRSWGNPDQIIFPRSSSKMIQALPLIESGAAANAGLTTEQLALLCASHQGAAIHSTRVLSWLDNLGLSDDDLRCGSEPIRDTDELHAMIRAGDVPCQCHNNCSGKHCGFLTLNKHLGGGSEYIEVDHPVQVAVRAAYEEACGEESTGYGIDGCSAPNFTTSVTGLGRAVAAFASADGKSDTRNKAMVSLRDAMRKHPELVAGEGRACTELMRASEGRLALKTGAEGVFVAIAPERKLGVVLKISDGATRASEAAIAAILVGLDLLPRDHPMVQKRINAGLFNRRNIRAAEIRPAAGLARI
ncbi:MAG: asparaginase [Paracoccaceae bacterium]|nr:asparaginase [Paracoccaceae bacterium]